MNLFVDTSSFVKYFHEEKGSDTVADIIQNPVNTIWISELTPLEFKSALFRKFRNKELNEAQLKSAFENFKIGLLNFNVIHFNSSIVNEANSLLIKHGKIKGLRTLDALQLATYMISKANTWQLLVSDKTLFETANALKIKAMYV